MTDYELTDEQIQMLAEVERMMDAGEMPFVIYGGQRAAVDAELMKRFGLKQGQTINDQIWRAILQTKIENAQRETVQRKTPN